MQRITGRLLAIPLLLVLCPKSLSALDGDGPVPTMKSVNVEVAKVGDTVTVDGEYLGVKHVAQVYLTDGKNDFVLSVVTQKDGAITVKIPKDVPAGKFNFMVLTARAVPSLLEQPVRIRIE